MSTTTPNTHTLADIPFRPFTLAAGISFGVQVSVDANGNAIVATAAGPVIGSTEFEQTVVSQGVTVRLYGPTHWGAVTAAPVTAGNILYAAANGAVSPTGTVPVGVALQSTTANGDVIEYAEIA